MSLYSRDDERAIRVQRLVHDWQKSGLVTAEQRDAMLEDLHVDLRRTNLFLRLTLFVFSALIINAVTGLTMFLVEPSSAATTWMALMFGAVCIFAAQRTVASYRLYRFGVEEALAIAAAVFFVWFGVLLFGNRFQTIYAFAFAAIGSYALYVRFGFLYAAVASIGLATGFVFDIEQSDTFRRLFALILLLTIFFFARERRLDHEPDFPADHYAAFEAVAWALMYLIVNLKISSWVSLPDDIRQVYWVSYGLIWLLPAAGLSFAIRDRHRWMLDVNIVLAIVTLMTNKPYLGIEQKPWDPILFGVMLIVVAAGLRRWLASGPNGSRRGYQAERILASEQARVAVAGTATVLAPGGPQPHSHEQPPSFGGGESGGGGASGKF